MYKITANGKKLKREFDDQAEARSYGERFAEKAPSATIEVIDDDGEPLEILLDLYDGEDGYDNQDFWSDDPAGCALEDEEDFGANELDAGCWA